MSFTEEDTILRWMFLNVMTIISVREILVISYNTQTDSEGVMIHDFSNKFGEFSGKVHTRFKPSLSFRPHSGVKVFLERDRRSFPKS